MKENELGNQLNTKAVARGPAAGSNFPAVSYPDVDGRNARVCDFGFQISNLTTAIYYYDKIYKTKV